MSTTTTAREGRKESDMDSITPAMRFVAYDVEHSLPYGPARRAIREARYWESFPNNYSPEKVIAARQLHRAIFADRTPAAWSADAENVLKLIEQS
jgi:hypothetical protein